MILTFLIDALLSVVQGLFSVLPTWSVDTSQMDTAKTVGLTAGSLNGWFPETFLFACLAVVLGVRLFMFAWNGLVWLYGLIPFNG